MDELERVIGRAAAFDAEQEAAANIEAEEQQQPTASEREPDSLKQAEKMAETLLKTGEKITKAFVDRRLVASEEEVADCRENVGPLLDKYGLASSGGVLPFSEELAAGFYLGGLIKRFRRTLAELRKADKAKKERESDGDQREHQTEERTQPVSGEKRVREKPDITKEGWNTESWGAGRSLGQQ